MILVLAALVVLGLASVASSNEGTPVPKAHAVAELPRLGNWIWPGKDPEMLKKCLALGLGFTSSYDMDPVVGRSLFEAGMVTDLCPGRPSGADLIAGLGLTAEDMDQDSQGNRTGEGFESVVFHESVPDRFAEYLRKKIRPVVNEPWVASVLVSSPVSMYGEVHYPASTAGQYPVFGRAAKTNYRNWLARTYHDDLAALSRAWGRDIRSWDEITPPDGPKADPGGIDTRREWSDFIHWYNWWLDEVTRRSLETVRGETNKPIGAMIGGPGVGFNQGQALGNYGPVVRMLGKLGPAFFNGTDGETLFSMRYAEAACLQYGVKRMQEHVGPPLLAVFHQYNDALNVLTTGADYVHLAHLGELFDDKHWFSQTWKNLAPLVLRYRTAGRKSDAAMFHSYMTSWYRPDRSNADSVKLYDSTNTLWTPDSGFPSWGRALGSPDVVDDAMVEDGGLKGRKLLVIANSSVTVTSRKAVDAIRKWVNGGGTLLGFGEGCLAYVVEGDRSLKQISPLAGLMPTAKVTAAKKRRGGNRIDCQVGKGRVVLFLKPADPELRDASGKRFVDEMMPVLRAEADKCGVRRWCNADDGYKANLNYCGSDLKSGRHLFTADLTEYVRNGLRDAIFYTNRSFQFTFDPTLKGDAELVAITDSFESCRGGKATFDAQAHTLIVKFRLPGKLTLKFGNGTSGLALAKHPLLLWDKGDLVLRPVGGYGVDQTQGPVRVTSDGDLEPKTATFPYLIHGKLHRDKLGGGPTFRLSMERPGSVSVHVNSVSVPVTLVMSLDGKEMLRKDLPNKDNSQDPFAGEYNEDITLDVPAGEHDVRIENLGEDWLSVDRYVFRGLGPEVTRVTIDPKDEKQVMHSFGASDAWTCQFVGKNWPLEKRNLIADLLFSMDADAQGNPKGIGLSMWRFNLGAGSTEQGNRSGIGSAWHRTECFLNADGTYDWNKQQGERWFMEAAKARGVEYLLAFTDSPPVQYTLNGIAHSDPGRHALNIRKDAMPKFADFLVDVAEHFKGSATPIDYVSPVNEPQWGWGSEKQEGSPASNAEICEISRLVGEGLHSKGLSTKVAVGEAGALHYMTGAMHDSTASDQVKAFWDPSSPECLAGPPNVAHVISGHSYFTTWPISKQIKFREPLRQRIVQIDPKLAFWQSEFCILESNDEIGSGHGRDLGMDTALYVARVIHSDLTIADASHWSWWLAVSQSDFKDGLVYIDFAGDYEPGKRPGDTEPLQHDGRVLASKTLWALGNFSRFVRPGMVRVGVQFDDHRSLADAAAGVMVSAYVDKKTGRLVIVLINCTKESQVVEFGDDLGIRGGRFITYTTSEDSDLAKGSSAADRVCVPARSVVTLVGKMRKES